MSELWLGDSRELLHNIEDRTIKCLILDPPYGVNFQSRRAETGAGKEFVDDLEGDLTIEEAEILFREVMEATRRKMAHEAEAYVFTRWDVVDDWIRIVKSLPPWQYKMMLIWDKGIPGMGDIDSNWGCGHELILYLKIGRREIPYRRSGIIAVDKVPNMKHIHPTEKPVGLIEKLLEMSTDADDLVVDPFAGSGSTLVAADRMGRRSIGIEKSPKFYERTQQRLGQGFFDLEM